MRTFQKRLKLNSLLYACKTSLRHGHFHRRMQIGLFIDRYNKTWKSPITKKLVDKYGAHEC